MTAMVVRLAEIIFATIDTSLSRSLSGANRLDAQTRLAGDPAGACMPVPSGLEVGHVRPLQRSLLWQVCE